MPPRLATLLLPLMLVSTTAAAQSISFNSDWSVVPSEDPLPVGGTVEIVYDANRLPQCRGTTGSGGPAWSITGYYQLNGGAVQSFWVAGHSPEPHPAPPSITLPEGESGDLSLWFQVTNLWGCTAWDSDYGRNFHFNVGAPSITFGADWSETVSGTLKAGQPFIVHYDLSRLPECRQTYNGLPTWEIVVEYRFDGGAVQPARPVTTTNGGLTRVSAPTPIDVPAGAHYVELWFRNTDRASCVRYDSNYGANYWFSIE